MNERIKQNQECSIIVVGRDRFSTTASCLETLIANTPHAYELIVVLGGVPKCLKENLVKQFGEKAKFIFEDRFLNPSESRNIGLRHAANRLAVLMDNDLYVRSGWLTPLLECQQETGAAMVVPLILEPGNVIHTAGNDFYVSYKNGRARAHKELRFHAMIFDESANLKRVPTDYGELHCQLVDAKAALELGVYDEKLQEVGECDSGLTWVKAGCSMWFEPRSVVHYDLPGAIAAEDIRFFIWKWDMRIILQGYRHFEKKWGMDISEHGEFRDWLLGMNKKIGLLPRLLPCESVLAIDHVWKKMIGIFTKLIFAPVSLWRRFRAWQLGYYEWKTISGDPS